MRQAHDWRRLAALGFCVVSIVVGFFLGEGYIDRLPRHAGYFLVAVDDEVRVPIPVRPRHSAFIVVDGLRRDAAETMRVTQELARAGQCRVSDQGSFTVSRPEYALLSTGLEVDRTGSRNNDLTAPLAAESIWQVARASGLHVSGSSHLRWFAQLFPEGFDRFAHQKSHVENVFAPETGELLDVNVFHPLYVDETAHQHGAASPEYAAAVARVDGEIAGLLARMDLSQDLVVMTADHGHRDAGGHGGAQPEIKNVLVCFAGRESRGERTARRSTGAARRRRSPCSSVSASRATCVRATTVSTCSGRLRAPSPPTRPTSPSGVPRSTASGTTIASRSNAGSAAGPAHGRGSTSARHARKTRASARLAFFVLVCAALSFRARNEPARRARHDGVGRVQRVRRLVRAPRGARRLRLHRDQPARTIHPSRRGGRDRLGGSRPCIAHAADRARQERLVGDLLLVVGLLLAMNLGHVYVYGWPLGFPLPPQPARYFPFFGAIALATYALAAGLLLEGRRPKVRVTQCEE